MVTLYYTWDGRPAPSQKEADWVVYYSHDRWHPWFVAGTTWRYSVSVYIDGYRESYTWWHIKAIRGWPAVLDLNSLVEMWIAREESSVKQFLEGRPFKPASFYNKPEVFVVDVMVADERRNKWHLATLGPDALAPLRGNLPYGEEHGCMVFDAWGRRPPLTPLCHAEIPDMRPDFVMLRGELPGAGWVVCWARAEGVSQIQFYAYLNFRGLGLVKVLSGKASYGQKAGDKYDVWTEKVWMPDFNKVELDLLLRDGEETA